MSRRGFTLIELLVVISIIALLSSVVLASLNSARDKARLNASRQFAAQASRLVGDQAVLVLDMADCSGTTVADRSGFGNNGSFGNSPTWVAGDNPTGQGCSISFSGSAYVSTGVSGLPALEAPKTVSVWAKYSTAASTTNLYAMENGSNALQVGFDSSGNVRAWKFGGISVAQTSLVPSAGDWHHYLYTFDGTTHDLYVDGIERASSTVAPQTGSVVSSNVGRYTGGQNFQGQIAGVRVFAKALTAAEVGRLYAEGAHRLQYAYED